MADGRDHRVNYYRPYSGRYAPSYRPPQHDSHYPAYDAHYPPPRHDPFRDPRLQGRYYPDERLIRPGDTRYGDHYVPPPAGYGGRRRSQLAEERPKSGTARMEEYPLEPEKAHLRPSGTDSWRPEHDRPAPIVESVDGLVKRTWSGPAEKNDDMVVDKGLTEPVNSSAVDTAPDRHAQADLSERTRFVQVSPPPVLRSSPKSSPSALGKPSLKRRKAAEDEQDNAREDGPTAKKLHSDEKRPKSGEAFMHHLSTYLFPQPTAQPATKHVTLTPPVPAKPTEESGPENVSRESPPPPPPPLPSMTQGNVSSSPGPPPPPPPPAILLPNRAGSDSVHSEVVLIKPTSPTSTLGEPHPQVGSNIPPTTSKANPSVDLIIKMHENRFPPLLIQQAFAKVRNEHLEISMIEDVISDYTKAGMIQSKIEAPADETILTAGVDISSTIPEDAIVSNANATPPRAEIPDQKAAHEVSIPNEISTEKDIPMVDNSNLQAAGDISSAFKSLISDAIAMPTTQSPTEPRQEHTIQETAIVPKTLMAEELAPHDMAAAQETTVMKESAAAEDTLMIDGLTPSPPSPVLARQLLPLPGMSPQKRLETLVQLQLELPVLIATERRQIEDKARKEEEAAQLAKEIEEQEERVRAMKEQLRTLQENNEALTQLNKQTEMELSAPVGLGPQTNEQLGDKLQKEGQLERIPIEPVTASDESSAVDSVVETTNDSANNTEMVLEGKSGNVVEIERSLSISECKAEIILSDREQTPEKMDAELKRNNSKPSEVCDATGVDQNSCRRLSNGARKNTSTNIQDRISSPGPTRSYPARRAPGIKSEPELARRIESEQELTRRIEPTRRREASPRIDAPTKPAFSSLSPSPSVPIKLGKHIVHDDEDSNTKPITLRQTTPKQRFAITGLDHYDPHWKRGESVVLLTNSYEGWENICVCLGNDDGKIEPLNCNTHRRIANGHIAAEDWAPTCASNGSWIGPGELALVHKDYAQRRQPIQLTMIKYTDPIRMKQPQINHMKRTPHGQSKISAIAPVRLNNGERTFATGAMDGRLYLWSLATDSSVRSQIEIHGSFNFMVTAIAYQPANRHFHSASKGLYCRTDLETLQNIGPFETQKISNDPISSIAPRPDESNETMLTFAGFLNLAKTSIRHKWDPLQLLDHRIPRNRPLSTVFSYPVPIEQTSRDPPWNHTGAWNPHDNRYFCLGGMSEVHMWDVRNPKKPVSSFDVGLANGIVIAVRFVGHELLAMSRRRLAWAKLEERVLFQ